MAGSGAQAAVPVGIMLLPLYLPLKPETPFELATRIHGQSCCLWEQAEFIQRLVSREAKRPRKQLPISAMVGCQLKASFEALSATVIALLGDRSAFQSGGKQLFYAWMQRWVASCLDRRFKIEPIASSFDLLVLLRRLERTVRLHYL